VNDAGIRLKLMNMINAVKILRTAKLVLHFELLNNSKTVDVRNKYFKDFIVVFSFLQLSGFCSLGLRKILGKLKNVSMKVSTKYNLLPERNAYQDHTSTKKCSKKQIFKKMYIIVKQIHSSLHSELF